MSRSAQTIPEKMIKVNHAGENGAVNIYRAQKLVSRLRAPRLVPKIDYYLSHEKAHRHIFNNYLKKHGIRQCVSYHICGIGGFLLGTITGLIGPPSVAATTYAVESVVLTHLDDQLSYLSDHDKQAYNCVLKIYADEKEHLDNARDMLNKNNKLTPALIKIVKFSTEMVIQFGMR